MGVCQPLCEFHCTLQFQFVSASSRRGTAGPAVPSRVRSRLSRHGRLRLWSFWSRRRPAAEVEGAMVFRNIAEAATI